MYLKFKIQYVHIDFLVELVPAQVVKLVENTTEQIINLNTGKFHNVDSITVFVVDNYGAPFSSIIGIEIFGIPVHATDVSKIKSVDS